MFGQFSIGLFIFLILSVVVYILKRGKSFATLCKELEIDKLALNQLHINYQKHEIAKKTGGVRTLFIPSAKLKIIQRKILKKILYKQKYHFCANAYIHGKSVIDNAKVHAGCAVLIKMDLRNFFPSIKPEMVKSAFIKMGWRKTVAEKLTEICCWKNGLPQGAPTSPALSNILFYEIDQKLFALALRYGARYSRYADDLTFSLKIDDSQKVRSIIKKVQLIVENNGFRLNFKKGKFFVLRPHQQQKICGLVINSGKPTISRKERRRVRAIKHRMKKGRATTMNRSQLSGLENFIKMVEHRN